jgi:HEPN domain-containing protein
VGKRQFAGISEQSKAGQHRRADADALFEKQRWRGAMYLAGYAIECLIKAKLMERFKQSNLEDLETEFKRRHVIPDRSSLFDHRIELYVGASGRLDALRSDNALWRSFNIANRWIPSWRYNPDLSNRADAEDFLFAVDAMLEWIRNNV